MNPKTLERLTRQKKSAAKSKAGSSATGRYLLPGGGRFSLAKPKGEFDWVVARAKQTPGPNQYSVKVNEWGTGGIKISDANPKSEIDWVIHRSKKTPAPNEYGLIKMPGPSGGQFSTAFPLTELDLTILRANDSPGPTNTILTYAHWANLNKAKLGSNRHLQNIKVVKMNCNHFEYAVPIFLEFKSVLSSTQNHNHILLIYIKHKILLYTALTHVPILFCKTNAYFFFFFFPFLPFLPPPPARFNSLKSPDGCLV